MKGRGPKLQPRSRVARRWVRGQVPSDVRTNTDVAVPAKKQSDMHAMIMHGMIIIICYHRSSVNLTFGLARSEPTKPGDHSMSGFDVIKKYHEKW